MIFQESGWSKSRCKWRISWSFRSPRYSFDKYSFTYLFIATNLLSQPILWFNCWNRFNLPLSYEANTWMASTLEPLKRISQDIIVTYHLQIPWTSIIYPGRVSPFYWRESWKPKILKNINNKNNSFSATQVTPMGLGERTFGFKSSDLSTYCFSLSFLLVISLELNQPENQAKHQNFLTLIDWAIIIWFQSSHN